MTDAFTLGFKNAVTLLPGSHRWCGIVNNAANDNGQILCATISAVTGLCLPLTSLICFYDQRPIVGIVNIAAGAAFWLIGAAIMAQAKLPKPQLVVIDSARYNTIAR